MGIDDVGVDQMGINQTFLYTRRGLQHSRESVLLKMMKH